MGEINFHTQAYPKKSIFQKMARARKNPRILIVTPEVTYLPDTMSDIADSLTAKAGGLADVSAALIKSLYEQGGDVHVTLPDYRSLFNSNREPRLEKKINKIKSGVPEERIHLAEDRAFFYMNQVYSCYEGENAKIALAFQREVINNIVPRVRPDLIHCNDWMTGLIPAMARKLGIPCLFTIHNIHTVKCPLSYIEDRGIDAASFWQFLFFDHPPYNYEESREYNPVNFLVSGIFAAHFVNTVSPTFLNEMIEGKHHFVKEPCQRELENKMHAGCAVGILNAPDPSFSPETDKSLPCRYSAKNHLTGKKKNKAFIQKTLGLIEDEHAPIFFWPSRLDPVQKGCGLLAEILYKVVSRYWEKCLQIIFVANGEFHPYFNDIIYRLNLHDRVVLCNFNERLSRIAYGASDFVFMPSSFEPCGLPQMIGPIYGTIPVAHDTGGIHDTVDPLEIETGKGNGFLFKTFNSNGLLWAMNQAMEFYSLSPGIKQKEITRIMNESAKKFNYSVTARHYIDLYEKMLKRPFISS